MIFGLFRRSASPLGALQCVICRAHLRGYSETRQSAHAEQHVREGTAGKSADGVKKDYVPLMRRVA